MSLWNELWEPSGMETIDWMLNSEVAHSVKLKQNLLLVFLWGKNLKRDSKLEGDFGGKRPLDWKEFSSEPKEKYGASYTHTCSYNFCKFYSKHKCHESSIKTLKSCGFNKLKVQSDKITQQKLHCRSSGLGSQFPQNINVQLVIFDTKLTSILKSYV